MPQTTNMNIPLPTVSTTLGPAWATLLNEQSFVAVDEHDHTSGKGLQIPSAGIDLDDDLSFNDNNATSLRSARLAEQSGELVGTSDLGCIYRSGVDLYYKDGNGTNIRITQSGAVTGAAGTITGLPSGTAGASFDANTGAFTFIQATNEYATMQVGPVVLHSTETSPNGITLTPPNSLAAAYTLTLPGALSSGGMLSVSSAGAIAIDADNVVGTNNIEALAVTRAKMAAVGQQVSSSCGTFATASTTFTAITNLEVTITTTGRPVVIACISDGSTVSSYFRKFGRVGASAFFLQLTRDGTEIAQVEIVAEIAVGDSETWAPSILWHLDAPAAGEWTYALNTKNNDAVNMQAINMKLVAYEL